MPIELARLTYNPSSSKYEIQEAGITYAMDLEHTRKLKIYYKHFHRGYRKVPTLAGWYASLSKEERKGVYRSGELPRAGSDFAPDPEYDD
jgi:hypothetical protein